MGQEPQQIHVPGNFKIMGSGQVDIDLTSYGIEIVGSVNFDGKVSATPIYVFSPWIASLTGLVTHELYLSWQSVPITIVAACKMPWKEAQVILPFSSKGQFLQGLTHSAGTDGVLPICSAM